MQKRNFTSLEVLAEQVRKAELRSLPVKAERKRGSRTSHIGSQGRAEVRKRNFPFLAAKAERKCRSLAVKTERKRNFRSLAVTAEGSAEAEHQVFGSQGRAEVWKENFRSLADRAEVRKQRNADL